MSKKYVCDGAKLECQLCTKPEGELKVTSNEVKIQDKKFANAKDKEKLNLIFQGNCKKSPYQAQPCQAVIQPKQWQNTADLIVQDAPALLENSTIICAYGGVPIKITDHLQKDEPGELQPVAAPVIAPIEDPQITAIEWKDELLDKNNKTTKTPNQAIENETPHKRSWLEITTLNILPGETIAFEIDAPVDKEDEL